MMTTSSSTLTKECKSALKLLDMVDDDRKKQPRLILVSEKNAKNYAEYIALENAKKYGVDAVYFRRFDRKRPPIPQIYIYDYINKTVDKDEIAELHKRLWNASQVPLFFVFNKTEVLIFNCLKQPKFDPRSGMVKYSVFETIQISAAVQDNIEAQKIAEFSGRKFDNGSFWEESSYKEDFKLNKGAFETLLNHLRKSRKDIIEKKILPTKIAQKLLVMAIMVKYLEERRDEEGHTVFPTNFFNGFAEGAKSFVDVLRKRGACLDLFDELSTHFDGEIFKWEDRAERKELRTADLITFAKFIEGKTELTGQINFWPLYSFNDLPIELISNIYEEFLGSKKEGVVYTPPYLVNFLIDECMPIAEPKTDFKILDPACGSGVFLVSAYRRLIYWWRIQNNWQKPELPILKRLLRNNIYGIDINPEAVRLAVFSLSLALCDELEPKVIWHDLEFDNLINETIITQNFFNNNFKNRFDLIIGNPPFIEKLCTTYAQMVEDQARRIRPKLPGKQLALLFLDQSMKLCKKQGLVCLIQPSGPFLYNNNSFEFRKYFLNTYNVLQILDFTSLSATLFGKANVATLAVFAKNTKPNGKNILHLTVKRTKASKEKIFFELDHYDFHITPYEMAVNNRFVFKSNLLGGGRLRMLLARLARFRTLGQYLEKKRKSAGWVIGEGFIVGEENEIKQLTRLRRRRELSIKELKKLQNKYKKVDYLTGKKTLPSEAFTEAGINSSRIQILKEKYFYRFAKRNKKIFKGPHLLIKEGISEKSIPIAFVPDDLTFRHGIIGVHTSVTQANELRKIVRRIKGNRIYLFFVAGCSGAYMINRATAILKKDIINLPFPEDINELTLTRVEKKIVDDVLDYIIDFRRKGENSKVTKIVNETQLQKFGDTYCSVLNSVYKKFKPCSAFRTESFVCFPFYYGKKPKLQNYDVDMLEKNLEKLVYKTVGISLRVVRVLRIYEDNIVYLIKPKQLRYWLESIAIRDADETFADLYRQGY